MKLRRENLRLVELNPTCYSNVAPFRSAGGRYDLDTAAGTHPSSLVILCKLAWPERDSRNCSNLVGVRPHNTVHPLGPVTFSWAELTYDRS